jgi:KUP system potassium uptake protein
MLVWFVSLGIFGLIAIFHTPAVLSAVNPFYGLKFLLHNGIAGFFVLSQIILCVTGSEALYADMGHLGREPIINAWRFVFFMLVLNYFGQGAYLLNNLPEKNILFSMVLSECRVLYVPFLIISIFAVIIASQAMISGLFSIIYQGMNTKIIPLFKMSYTSEKLKGQIYIGAINWFLFVCVIIMILFFKKSSSLAGAYGFAVSGAMLITCILMSSIFFLRKNYPYFCITVFLMFIDVCFFVAACSKIPHGAYWSIIAASIPLFLIILFTKGNKILYKSLSLMNKKDFLNRYLETAPNVNKIEGTALFFVKSAEKIPPYLIETMFTNNIIYTDNIIVSINQSNEPHGVSYEMSDAAVGLRILKIKTGYMEILKLEEIFYSLQINEKAIFYGVEDIESENPFWIIFAKIKKLLPSFMHFYKLPTHKVHGVMTKIEMK